MNKLILGTAAAMLAAAVAPAAQAAPNLVTNGDFSQTSSSTPSEIGLNGYSVTGWTSGKSGSNLGYNFIFSGVAGSAGNTSLSEYTNPAGKNTVVLYTNANGGLATDPSNLSSPNGGNFLAADPSYHPGTISQTINGLTVGQAYTLSFYWGASQQVGMTGDTYEGWTGSLGSSTFSTGTVNTASKGFSNWQLYTTTIKATSTSEVLSFLATGGPSGSQPPFALLDGVSLSAVPEAGTWAMMLGGFGLMGFALRRRAKVARLANA